MSLAERCRTYAGNGAKLAWLYACVAGLTDVEATEQAFDNSSAAQFALRIKSFLREASIRDRLYCAARLEDRAFGLAKQEVEHSGEVAVRTRVVHEYHSS